MRKLLLILCLISFSVQAATWECISRNITCHTWRMYVPGGWIVSGDNGDAHYAMIYYPDSQHAWKG